MKRREHRSLPFTFAQATKIVSIHSTQMPTLYFNRKLLVDANYIDICILTLYNVVNNIN